MRDMGRFWARVRYRKILAELGVDVGPGTRDDRTTAARIFRQGAAWDADVDRTDDRPEPDDDADPDGGFLR